MRTFDTLVEAISSLKKDGFELDFNLESNQIYCKELALGFSPNEFKVIEFFRFEGDSNPDDNSILYAIETESGKKGLLLDAYGAYSGEVSQELIQALKIR